METIVQNGNPVLRIKTQNVPVGDISSKKIQTILKKMEIALGENENGVALAAPQIGESLRIFIVSKKAFEEDQLPQKSLVYINPEIIKISKKTESVEEACLSIRGFSGEVTRAKNITVKAYDKDGNEFARGAGGLLAQIFQHEIDHLNGILYIDKATETHKLPTDDTKKNI